MISASDKIFEIAGHLKDLNKYGKVKGLDGNEKGYAKVIEIFRGCSVWVHHLHNDDLIIDLMVSHTAHKKNPALCDSSVKKFEDFFGGSGGSVKKTKWTHSIDQHYEYERHYVVMNDKKTAEIIDIVDNLKKIFA
jgi:hypothetical protein